MLKTLIPVTLTWGCLEKVTGETVPLDERFTVQATATSSGTDTGGPAHAEHEHQTVEHKEVPPPQPFQDHEGERVAVAGTITSPVAGSVDLDVATVDDSVEGGSVREGKLILGGPGSSVSPFPPASAAVLSRPFRICRATDRPKMTPTRRSTLRSAEKRSRD